MTKTAFVLAALSYGTQAIKLMTTQEQQCFPGLLATQWAGWEWLEEFPELDRDPVEQWVETDALDWRIESDNGFYHSANDKFVVEYEGWLDVPESGDWKIWVSSDDGGQLIIDDEMIVNENKRKEFQYPKSAELTLDAGLHKFKARMFECSGWAGFKLEAEGPGFEKAVIPADAFRHGNCKPKPSKCQPGLVAKQWAGWQWLDKFPELDRDPVDEWIETDELNWRIKSDNGMYHEASDQFVVEYDGWVYVPESGMWKIWMFSDDGGQLYFDDELILDENKRKEFQYPVSHKGKVDAGWHKLTARMFECSGWAGFRLVAAGPGFEKAVIPASAYGHGKCDCEN